MMIELRLADKKMVYICSPFRADDDAGMRRNMHRAKMYEDLFSSILGAKCVAPHAHLPNLLDEHNAAHRELGLDFGLKLLELCDLVLVCGKRISRGMRAEIFKAQSLGIPVVFVPDPAKYMDEETSATEEELLKGAVKNAEDKMSARKNVI